MSVHSSCKFIVCLLLLYLLNSCPRTLYIAHFVLMQNMEISCFELHKAVNERLSKGRCSYATRLDEIGVSVSEWLCVFTVPVVYTKTVKLVNCCICPACSV